jgi:hypothetical protein
VDQERGKKWQVTGWGGMQAEQYEQIGHLKADYCLHVSSWRQLSFANGSRKMYGLILSKYSQRIVAA